MGFDACNAFYFLGGGDDDVTQLRLDFLHK